VIMQMTASTIFKCENLKLSFNLLHTHAIERAAIAKKKRFIGEQI